ncbi:hypothetical protein MWH28_07310 [Natroniella sulfidigena]|uniref:hypothetical protein n=1 Tax=Natroniella sulfidigena TaxID=723921 RepID=UPI00200B795E|nr:hypothetical protein [Natroniella sulfidigena]MCK8817167.1 hypothetical protein [Natroniella sulfidigena]
MLDRLEKAMFYLGQNIINIDKLKAIKHYINANCLNDKELQKIKQYIREFNEDKITELLRDNFDNFKKAIKENNRSQFASNGIEKQIEVLTADYGEQLSLF